MATEFVPWFPETKKEFKPLVIKRIYYENQEPETQESAGSASTETQSGITPQDQQAVT